jgi:hypothetical protein
VRPAQRLGDLESEDDVGLPLGDERRVDLLPESHVARDDAAALRHPVDLALFGIQPHHLGDLAEHLAREQHPLPAHSYD